MSWELRRVPWTPQEDERLRRFVLRYGTNCWSTAPDRAQLLRDARSCRERWHFYLSPDRKCGPITAEEEELIIHLHSIYSDWWWKIAWGLPGRTPKQIKNHWRSHLSPRLVAQGIDPRTHRPITVEAAGTSQSTSVVRTMSVDDPSAPDLGIAGLPRMMSLDDTFFQGLGGITGLPDDHFEFMDISIDDSIWPPLDGDGTY